MGFTSDACWFMLIKTLLIKNNKNREAALKKWSGRGRETCVFVFTWPYISIRVFYRPGADLGGGCKECVPLPEMIYGFLKQLVFCKKVWFIGVQLLRHSLVVHPLLRKFLDPPLPPFSLYKFVHFFFSGGYACILNSLNGKTFDRNYQTAEKNNKWPRRGWSADCYFKAKSSVRIRVD